jgi:surface polysaccharide O-acyltransferase-like enzyme
MPGMATALRVLGGYHVLLGLFMLVAPGAFYSSFGPFPPENHHYIRDVATFYLAIGFVTLGSANRPAWRVPVLLLILVEYAVHVVNHVVDVGKAETTLAGVTDIVALAAVTALVAGMLVRARRDELRDAA